MGAQVEETFQMSIELNVDPQKVYQECSAQGFYTNHQETSSETEKSEEFPEKPFVRTPSQKNVPKLKQKKFIDGLFVRYIPI